MLNGTRQWPVERGLASGLADLCDVCGPEIVEILPGQADPDLRDGPAFLFAHYRGLPLAYGLHAGPGDWSAVVSRVRQEAQSRLAVHCVEHALSCPCPDAGYRLRCEDLDTWCPPPNAPSITVAICTRAHRPSLYASLAALAAHARRADLLVVVNGLSDAGTAAKIREVAPAARVYFEPRVGLNWARNAAIQASQSELLAFIDDDVTVSPTWLYAVLRTFTETRDVAAVTGLLIPAQLQTPSQVWFEDYAGFGRGCRSVWWQTELSVSKSASRRLSTWAVGTGGNMAFRRDALLAAGGFHPALDAGTPVGGSGDLEMFYRLLSSGAEVVYVPEAMASHTHRSTREELLQQVAAFGSYASMLLEIVRVDRKELLPVIAVLPEMMGYFSWRAWEAFSGARPWWRGLLWAELTGYAKALTGAPLRGSLAYARQVGTATDLGWPRRPVSRAARLAGGETFRVDVTHGVSAGLVTARGAVTLEVLRAGRWMGRVQLFATSRELPAVRIRQAIAEAFAAELTDPRSPLFRQPD